VIAKAENEKSKIIEELSELISQLNDFIKAV
jgi:hypothetical protein